MAAGEILSMVGAGANAQASLSQNLKNKEAKNELKKTLALGVMPSLKAYRESIIPGLSEGGPLANILASQGNQASIRSSLDALSQARAYGPASGKGAYLKTHAANADGYAADLDARTKANALLAQIGLEQLGYSANMGASPSNQAQLWSNIGNGFQTAGSTVSSWENASEQSKNKQNNADTTAKPANGW